ncbi:GFA family protein [Labrys wisconsinensis]|uniref:CENP-V/GFA domain-containing protein n=1 Tax=Labrys wisconsinensis TaxID=425677 RepID=A0ABU0J533_9HYPH|nr:GFA family protein [Labrys wisconsinensis]MDQ0468568.1 hypothetical protein [Labrys wisconsinensis]
MSKPYLGGCACGAVRYQIDDEPVFENHCQCRDCQRRSGTGHSSFLTFPDRAKAVVTGKVTTWHVAGDSGNEKIHAFCPTCGTPVHLTFAAMPDLLSVHAASLDSPELFHPSVVTYHARALDWDAVDPGLTKVQKMPQA